MKTALIAVLALTIAGCSRERRDFKLPNGEQLTAGTRLTALQPGSPSDPGLRNNPLEDNAYALNEGKRLFSAYNCTGCHAHGGGAIGPALMDHRWIYGSRPDQIFSTIVQGRPNGMPSFGGKIPEQEIWQIVAYVESMSGNQRKDASPNRDDDMSVGKPESRREAERPVQTGHR
jgi:cytochrome c oxidase cbb3-type subunit 3